MRIVEFSPDHESRYLVGVARVDERDARPIGGTKDAVVVTFGYERRLTSLLLEFNPTKHRFLDADKVQERLQIDDKEGRLAASLAIAHVLGRETLVQHPDGGTLTGRDVGWSDGWEEQLAPLVAYLAATKEGGDGDAPS